MGIGEVGAGLGELLGEVFEVFVSAVVARVVDQLAGGFVVLTGFLLLALGEVEAGVFEVAVGFVEAHFASGRDFHRFVEVEFGGCEVAADAVEVGSGEQAAG